MEKLGDRMKRHEQGSRSVLPIRTPVIVRVDGRAFHTFTRGFKPFDNALRNAMIGAASKVASEMQGFQVAYHQSDEVSFLLTDYSTLETCAWFDYVTQKVASIAASAMSVWFNKLIYEQITSQYPDHGYYDKIAQKIKDGSLVAYFDARAFTVPREDVANYFVWRCKDWERNSLSMYCMQSFSHKQLHGKTASNRHEMLHGIGKNWATDVEPAFRNGSFILKDRTEEGVVASYPSVSKLIDPLVYPLQTVSA
jgi:tRNA(His) guanylyltransferase